MTANSSPIAQPSPAQPVVKNPAKPKRAKRSKKLNRPAKPDKSIELYAHGSGRWCAKIDKKFYYFNRWGRVVNGKVEPCLDDTAKEALKQYETVKRNLREGQTAQPNKGDVTLKDLANLFLTAKLTKVKMGDRSQRTMIDYHATCKRLLHQFGKKMLAKNLGPTDFDALLTSMAKTLGPVSRKNEIMRVKAIFHWAAAREVLEKLPNFGPDFVKPEETVIKNHKYEKGKLLFEAAELQKMLATAKPAMKAMILLGINCGYGNSDIAGLQLERLDKMATGWIEYRRAKTAKPRRCPLWPETVEAVTAVLAARPAAKLPADANCVFLTPDGARYVVVRDNSRTDYVSRKFGELLKELKINGRQGLNYYALRHTFATRALQSKDRDAVAALMGHTNRDMLAHYDETGPMDARLLAVTKCVHDWLFASSC